MRKIKEIGVSANAVVISHLPVKALGKVYSDRAADNWEQKAKEAESSRDNALRIYQAKARIKTAKNQMGVAHYSYGIGAIQSDHDAARVRQAIAAHAQACNPQQFLDVDARIRGQLGGGQ